jgi:hypothetical protein
MYVQKSTGWKKCLSKRKTSKPKPRIYRHRSTPLPARFGSWQMEVKSGKAALESPRRTKPDFAFADLTAVYRLK